MSHLNQANRKTHHGFTLVELLVVLTVMVTLGAMLTYALASAETDARIKRTQADALTIGQLLQSRMNEVSLSQVSLTYGLGGNELERIGLIGGQAPVGFGAPSGSPTAGQLTSFAAAERGRLILLARRDLMRLTMPECRADLLYPPASIQFRTRSSTGGNRWVPNVAQLVPPAQWNRMRTLVGLYSAATIDARVPTSNPASDPTVDGIAAAYNGGWQQPFVRFSVDYNDGTNPPVPDTIFDDPGIPNDVDRIWTREHESSECLYLILATTELFGKKAIDKIPSTQIDDTDGDGFPEILDSWGNPYAYIRNPVGFSSPAIKNTVPGAATLAEQYPLDPDPLDFLGVDIRFGQPDTSFYPIYCPPVIISAGRDGDFGLRTSFIDRNESGSNDAAGDDGDDGVHQAYSSSVVRFNNNNYGPRYPIIAGNTVTGTMLGRYPDPFFNVVESRQCGPDHIFTAAGIVAAKQVRGTAGTCGGGTLVGGLGTTLDRDEAADNISSLDADL